MIELFWNDLKADKYQQVVAVTNIMLWLSTYVQEHQQELNGLSINGYVVVMDYGKIHCVVTTDEKNEKTLLNILQQPPNEFKEKYVACIHCEEPEVVVERLGSINGDVDDEDDCGEMIPAVT